MSGAWVFRNIRNPFSSIFWADSAWFSSRNHWRFRVSFFLFFSRLLYRYRTFAISSIVWLSEFSSLFMMIFFQIIYCHVLFSGVWHICRVVGMPRRRQKNKVSFSFMSCTDIVIFKIHVGELILARSEGELWPAQVIKTGSRRLTVRFFDQGKSTGHIHEAVSAFCAELLMLPNASLWSPCTRMMKSSRTTRLFRLQCTQQKQSWPVIG